MQRGVYSLRARESKAHFAETVLGSSEHYPAHSEPIVMKPKLTQAATTEAFTEQIRYALPHKILTLTFAVVALPNQPPLLYITNETDQLHQRPRCLRATTVPYLERCYFYERACIDVHDGKYYEVDCCVIELYPSAAMPNDQRWSIHARLIECREIYPDGNSNPETVPAETDTL